MRSSLIGLVVAVSAALAPLAAFAGDQEVAQQIASQFKTGGQLKDYKIWVKYENGQAWLKGRVANPAQMATALQIARETPGVRGTVNQLVVSPSREVAATPAPVRQAPTPIARQPLQQVAGAMGREHLPRTTPATLGAAQARRTYSPQHVAQTFARQPLAPLPVPTQRADRVPTSYASGEIRPVAASSAQIPTPAAPRAPQPQYPVANAQTPAAMAPQAMRPIPLQPMPVSYAQQPGQPMPMAGGRGPMPMYVAGTPSAVPARYDQPNMPNYAWPSYAAHPNYAALTYPKQYSPTAWPYIGPFYPYPQVPMGWRKVTLEWHDGWWQLDFKGR